MFKMLCVCVCHNFFSGGYRCDVLFGNVDPKSHDVHRHDLGHVSVKVKVNQNIEKQRIKIFFNDHMLHITSFFGSRIVINVALHTNYNN